MPKAPRVHSRPLSGGESPIDNLELRRLPLSDLEPTSKCLPQPERESSESVPECSPGPPPLMIESNAQCEDGCFHALPSLEHSESKTPKPQSASQERSASLPSRECLKLGLRLTPLTRLSRISLRVYHHSLPTPRSQSPRPHSKPRCPKAISVHSPALSHEGSGLALSSWTSVKTDSRSPGLSPFQAPSLPRRSPK